MTSQFLTPQNLHTLLESPVSTEPPPAGLNSPILGLLASANREILAHMITECSYPPGAIIFNEGDIGDALYIDVQKSFFLNIKIEEIKGKE